MTEQPTTVMLLGKPFPIRCPKDKTDELASAAKYLNEKLETIQRNNPQFSLENSAITAALNITHELLNQNLSQTVNQDLQQQLTALDLELTNALNES